MNSRLRALIFVGVEDGCEHPRLRAGAAVRLVSDHEVERRRAACLCGRDLRRGLVGGEHDPCPVAAPAQEAGDPLGSVVTGTPSSEVEATTASCSSFVRPSRPSRPRGSRTRRPSPTRAASARAATARGRARAPACAAMRSRKERADERLARPARHHELAAIRASPDPLTHVLDRLALVWAGRFRFGFAGRRRVSERGQSHFQRSKSGSAGASRPASPGRRACAALSARGGRCWRSGGGR